MKKSFSVLLSIAAAVFITSGLNLSYAQITRINDTSKKDTAPKAAEQSDTSVKSIDKEISGTLKQVSPSSDLRQISKTQVPEIDVEVKASMTEVFPDGTPCKPQAHPALKPAKEFKPKIHQQFVNEKAMELIATTYNCTKFQFYRKDGSIFKNREGILPKNEDPSYYREYTLVPRDRKPGDGSREIKVGDKTYKVTDFLGQRGSERLIIGGFEHIYYTPDHYKTFIKITVDRD